MPNTPVDVNSWGVSACYPRRTFYPLSDGPSTWNHRITMTDFRLCSACRPYSQAGFCHCTRGLISDQPEPTIVRLRYNLGGDRPSQTTHHAVSLSLHETRLDAKSDKGGISRMSSAALACCFRRLPPILHMADQASLRSYSKGARGLSV